MSTDLKMPAVPQGAMWYAPCLGEFYRWQDAGFAEVWEGQQWVRLLCDHSRADLDNPAFVCLPQPDAWTDLPALPKGPMLCEVMLGSQAYYSFFDGGFCLTGDLDYAQINRGHPTYCQISRWRPADCAEQAREAAMPATDPAATSPDSAHPVGVCASDQPGIATFTPQPERVKPEPMATPVSTLRRGWRWLESQS